ncbi:unnamed protein product, partial [Thlaspi arvense]
EKQKLMISFTSKLMAYLEELLPGLTPEVFRTHNASLALETMLSEEMGDADVNQKYQATKKAAIVCNLLCAISKSPQLEKLEEVLKELETGSGGEKARNLNPKAWRKKIQQTNLKINQMERQMHFEFHTKVLNESLIEKFPWVMKGESEFKY